MLQQLLAEETVVAHVQAAYQLTIAELEFLPLGADAQASVYRVTATNGRRYFLKIRQGALNEAGLLIPHYLQQQGIAQVVAPLLTSNQALWQPVDDLALILYPYVTGRTGLESGLSPSQWRTLGAMIRQVHTVQLPPALSRQLQRETFVPDWIDIVQTALAQRQSHLAGDAANNPIAQELAMFWDQNAGLIQQLAGQAEALGQAVGRRTLPHVLCHADLHTANVLVDEADQLWLVDWDQAMLAPKERDLMFVVDGAVLGPIGDAAEAAFLQGYGEGEIDQPALAYYRYAWAVQDIGAFADEIWGRPDLSQAAKAQALRYFKSLFDPRMIVAAALRSAI